MNTKTIFKCFVIASVLLLAIVFFHAAQPLTAAVEGVVVCLSLIPLGWLEMRRLELEPKPGKLRPPQATQWRRAESRYQMILLVMGAVYGLFLSRHGSIEEFFQSRRGAQIAAEIAPLLESQQWKEAARLLARRLAEPLDDTTRAKLQAELLNCWLHMAESASDAELSQLVADGESLAQKGFIDPRLVNQLQKVVERRRGSEERQRQLAQDGKRQDAAERQEKLATLIAWGDSLAPRFEAQRAKFTEAIRFGQTWKLNTRVVEERLAAVNLLLEKQRPRNLPPGSTARLLSLKDDQFPPVLVAEIGVADSSGKFLDGLEVKDFRVELGGHVQSPLAVGRAAPATKKLQIVVLIDCSGSTDGPPLTAAKSGIARLLTQLGGEADFCLIAFSASAVPITAWETDARTAASRLDGLRAEGGTNLYAATGIAIAAFQGRSGPRMLVLFSDGKDTSGTGEPATLIEQLRREQIVLHAVGLQTSDFDPQAIERLTSGSGGQLVTASEVSQIADRFGELSHLLNAPRYRLVVPCETTSRKLRVVIGGGNPLALEKDLVPGPAGGTPSAASPASTSLPPANTVRIKGG